MLKAIPNDTVHQVEEKAALHLRVLKERVRPVICLAASLPRTGDGNPRAFHPRANAGRIETAAEIQILSLRFDRLHGAGGIEKRPTTQGGAGQGAEDEV
jgi:hypothetical protein